MKIGIMQPYFFPYIGYFQLIDAVDIFVNLDHVSFMKRSYMVRNKIKDDININVPVIKGSQNKSCCETYVNFSNHFVPKFIKKLKHLYSKEKNYEIVLNYIILPNFIDSKISISNFNLKIIKNVCQYLDIKTKIIDSSLNITNKNKEEGLKEIVHKLNGDTYINPIGGQSLYNKKDFKKSNINLFFIKMDEVEFNNKFSSILDILFLYDKEHIKQQLKKYSLI